MAEDTAEDRISAAGMTRQLQAIEMANHTGEAVAVALVGVTEVLRQWAIEVTRALPVVYETALDNTVLQPTGEVILNPDGHVEVPLEEIAEVGTSIEQLIARHGMKAVHEAVVQAIATHTEHICLDGVIREGPREGCCDGAYDA